MRIVIYSNVPGNPAAAGYNYTGEGTPGYGAATDYAAIGGSEAGGNSGYYFLANLSEAGCTAPKVYPGSTTTANMAFLIPNAVRYISQVTDGTSNTIVVSECAGGPDGYALTAKTTGAKGPFGAWASPTTNISLSGSIPGTGALVNSGSNNSVPGTGCTAKQTNGGTNGNGTVLTANTVYSLNCTMNCTNQMNIFSGHPTGCNFLFGDGSVHYIGPNIGWPTLAALATANQGESIDQSSY
jgi:prepilin-type processing-associated H-X9-DG protein